ITPLNTTLEVIKNQMLLVSVAFVLLSLVFSFYASRRIAKPIAQTNRAAKELAQKNYEIEFNASGYREVEELNNTLNYTKTELAATEKLQRELIANISHDLRTPLTMITGYGEVMRDLPGENTPENIQIIIDEATRLSTLVNDLLDLSKLQSGALQAQKQVFNLTDSVRAILERYSKLVEQEGFDIRFESKEEVFINADELRISQVIYNLVNNAVNHAGEDKTVIITQTVRDKLVRIEVIDHGEGIPADKLPYIWERYYKVDKEHKRGVIGSGLGLSIVKSILDAHKAHYGVRSTQGKGSTFWFEIAYDNVKKRKTKDK
ncbi:MAG: HAMP domain-containing histidine kinase, partial [Ruminococcus sp.]|nr:HAMP domain-containing histidine kinase [Ruminococcus sp.]